MDRLRGRWDRFQARPEWDFFRCLHRADRKLASTWWALLVLLGMLPAALAVTLGEVVGAVQQSQPLTVPLALLGATFFAMQVFAPLHAQVGTNLGSRMSAYLYDRLMDATLSPPGMAHLERADLSEDLTLARDFDQGISGPPMSISMGFIAGGLVAIVSGLGSAVVLAGYRWWAPWLIGGAWASTHWFLRESSVWKDRQTPEVMEAQRHADYAYRLAVDPPAAKELRMFGLAGFTVKGFAESRKKLVDLRYHATRLREQSVRWALLVVLAANVLFFWMLAQDVAAGRLALGGASTFAFACIGTSAIAFGGLNWSLSLAAQVVQAVLRLEGAMGTAGALRCGDRNAQGAPAHAIRLRDVRFQYETGSSPVLDGLDLDVPAGTSLAIVGQNGAGKTTIAKLLCRLYDPQHGTVEIDGVDLRDFDLESWRQRVASVFQDFVRFELPLRDNVAPHGAPDVDILAALEQAGAGGLAELDTVMARAYPGGIDLSGGQWQRIAPARALCAVRLGAGLVILDEPTAQLDVRGESEIFERILHATRECTTILVSHRFSTVRHADRICVLEEGRVIELGSHEELMELGGRYRTMFDLQASRFTEEEDDVIHLD